MSEPCHPTSETTTNTLLMVLVCLTFVAFSLGTAPVTICSLASLAAWLFSGLCYRKRDAWLGQPWTVPLLLLVVLPWVAMLWSSSMVNTISHASRSHYWVFACVAATVMGSEETLRRVMISYIVGIVFTSLVVLLSHYGVLPDSYFMAGTIKMGYITYSLLIVIAIALLAFFYRSTTSTRSRILLAVVMITLASTVTSLSGRSGYLALAMVSPWVFCTMFGRRRLIPILVALVAIFALLFISPKVRERVGKIPHEIKLYQAGDPTDTPVGARLEMWQSAWKIFSEHPLAGAGTAGLWHETNAIKPGHGINHPHNSYLYVAANYGIFGLVVYGWLLLVTLRRGWQARGRLSGYSILVFLAVILIGSLTDTQILSTATGILLGFVVGIPTKATEQLPPCAS